MTLPALLTDMERIAELLPPGALALFRRRLDDAMSSDGVVTLTVRCRGQRVQRPVEIETGERV